MQYPKKVTITPAAPGKRPQLQVRIEFSPNAPVAFALSPSDAARFARGLLKAISGPGEQRLRLVHSKP